MVDLSDGDLAAMMLQAPIAMTADIGSKGDQVGGTRAEVLQRLRDLLADTREYMRRRADYERNATREMAARRGDLEAMIPVVQGRLPLRDRREPGERDRVGAQPGEGVLAQDRDQRWRGGVDGRAEAAAAKVPVIVGALNNIPVVVRHAGGTPGECRRSSRRLAHGADQRWGRRLQRPNVRFEAGVAVAFGMPWAAALRAVTLSPAETFGVADRIGSLQPGREATW